MLSISNKWDRGRAAFQMSHVCVLLWLMCSKPWNENEIHFNEVKVIYIQGHMLIWLINTKVKPIKPVNTAYFLCWYDLFLNMGWLILSCKNQLFFKEKKTPYCLHCVLITSRQAPNIPVFSGPAVTKISNPSTQSSPQILKRWGQISDLGLSIDLS